MKRPSHLNPAFAAAIFCALLWFALWLIPFSPEPRQTVRASVRPPAAFLPGAADSMPNLRSPALFALPSEKGFSGTFPESRVNRLIPSGETAAANPFPETPDGPSEEPRYLSRKPAERASPDETALQEAMPEIKADLPVPGSRPTAPVPQPEGITLFLSPELQKRTEQMPQLTVPGTLPPSVRIYLGIRPDGTVDQVLFDTPVENKALAGAVRKLRFKPAAGRTDSWLDLRFTPGGTS